MGQSLPVFWCPLCFPSQDQAGGNGPVQVRVRLHLVGEGGASNRSSSLILKTRYLGAYGLLVLKVIEGLEILTDEVDNFSCAEQKKSPPPTQSSLQS